MFRTISVSNLATEKVRIDVSEMFRTITVSNLAMIQHIINRTCLVLIISSKVLLSVVRRMEGTIGLTLHVLVTAKLQVVRGEEEMDIDTVMRDSEEDMDIDISDVKELNTVSIPIPMDIDEIGAVCDTNHARNLAMK